MVQDLGLRDLKALVYPTRRAKNSNFLPLKILGLS